MISAPHVADDQADRRADLAAIHIGKKALGWDTDQYRDLLWSVCQVRSSGDLDRAGRRRFLDHMRACGWSKAPARPARARTPWTRQQNKAWSLWQQLADAGLVRQRSLAALEAWVRRHGPTAVASFQWLRDGAQIDLVIVMLKQWLKRKPDA